MSLKVLSIVFSIVCLLTLTNLNKVSALTKSDALKFNKYSKQALAAYSKKDYKQSIEKFTLASKIKPSDIPVRYYLGMAGFNSGNYKLASEELARVVVAGKNNSSYYKNALQCFTNYKKELRQSKPYSCATNTGKYFRWDQSNYPLKVFISHGLKLPKGFREKPLSNTDHHKMSGWLRSKSFVAKIRRDKHYKDTFWNSARDGVAEWGFARKGNLVNFKLVKDPYDADIVIFWCSKLQANKSATTAVPTNDKDKAIIQISVEYILQLQAHHRADAVRYITAHEFGHALGLKNSTFNRDIMYPIEKTKRHNSGFHPGGANRVSINDSTTIAALYSMPPFKK